MPHALLLSPDDQAVSAITGVLEEMSVTWERPLDGVSAAQKLNSQSFDLVLVDCENLPAAKLIFDVCRRGKNGHNPVPIAIVDGRAGLPTAFRLGAELILTKPVAKDQARTTIRTAVSRVRKEGPVVGNASTNSANDRSVDVSDSVGATLIGTAATGTDLPLPDSSPVAGASQVDAPQLTSFAEPAPSFVAAVSTAGSTPMKAPASSATAAATRSVTAYMKEVKSEEQTGERVIKIKAPAESKLTLPPTTTAVKFDSPSIRPSEGGTKAPLVMKPSEDPVLAALERSELEADTKKSAADKSETARADGAKSPGAGERHHGSDLILPSIQPKRNGMLAGTLMLALAGGGLYAVWNYQPEFRTMAQAQINHLLSLVGVEHAGGETPKPAKVQAIAVASPSTSEVKSTNDVNQAAATPVDGAAGSAVTGDLSSTAVAEKNASTTTIPQNNADKTVAQPVGTQAVDAKASEIKLAESKITTVPSNTKSESASASKEPTVDSDSEAVILSSQGAQKRLIYSVPPKYPVDQRPRGTQGTIVLKTDVQASGKVGSVRVVEGNPALATAAVDAVKQWRYRPYLRSGKAQAFQTVVIVDFQRP